ncbi:class I SAM-dependent methyltransferase [Muriicola marianensis]|uniref:Methyltransferase n=1 Tax=Muriicola marianensis TaxID=1324801 RepID=A0ABQ1QZ09_9FLAO|nr:class I SAM-dependent methyltransferase [Muriicola marianensis]GGD50090.1 methyltransferase [Muriicola marianensis]
MKHYLTTKDYANTGETFVLELDEQFQLLRTTPCPDKLDPYYQHESYISHTDRSFTFLEKLYQLVKKYSLRKKLDWIQEYAGSSSAILDVGAGTGSFVSYIRSKDWKADGVEPNKKAREIGASKGVSLFENTAVLSRRKYDVITMWHVMEHFVDLNKQLDPLLGLVKEEGTLFIALPNFKSHDAEYYAEYWAAYDVPRHLWHFSRTAIEKIFQERGWKVVATKPMLFDAFYISLLSEEYKGNRFKWPSACWRGFMSNLYAMRTGEYSSLVYVLQKG